MQEKTFSFTFKVGDKFADENSDVITVVGFDDDERIIMDIGFCKAHFEFNQIINDYYKVEG